MIFQKWANNLDKIDEDFGPQTWIDDILLQKLPSIFQANVPGNSEESLRIIDYACALVSIFSNRKMGTKSSVATVGINVDLVKVIESLSIDKN